MVPKAGLEPARLSTPAFETGASTNSAIWAFVGGGTGTRTLDPPVKSRVLLKPTELYRL